MENKIYYGGNIITMEDTSPEAMLLVNGRISKLGAKEELFNEDSSAEKINLDGKTIMPSFIDAHSHITAFAGTLRLVGLNGCASFNDIVNRLKGQLEKGEYSEENWLVGFGYDHNVLAEKAHLTKNVLDEVSKTVPIVICHASGHMGCANSMALKLAGICNETENPEGGKIGRDESGEINGYLEEKAFINMNGSIPPPSKEEYFSLLNKAQQVYASFGITTVQDGLTGDGEYMLLSEYAKNGGLMLDTVMYTDLKHSKAVPNKDYENHLRAGGIKIFLDGSPQGRTAWLREPYKGETEYRGYPIYKDEEALSLCVRAKNENKQLLAHCNGDRAAQQYIECLSEAGYPKSLRPVMIHAQLLGLDQLDRVKELGIIPSYFVAHTYYWGDVHIQNLGMDRAEKISPAKSSLEKGIIFTFHQDTPVILPNMLETVRCAVQRKTMTQVDIGPQERISVIDALKAVTINAAYQYFEEEIKGSIKEGKLADLVILSGNPLTDDIDGIEILETIKAGKSVFKK